MEIRWPRWIRSFSRGGLHQADVSYTAALYEGKIAQVLLRQTLGEFALWNEEEHG